MSNFDQPLVRQYAEVAVTMSSESTPEEAAAFNTMRHELLDAGFGTEVVAILRAVQISRGEEGINGVDIDPVLAEAIDVVEQALEDQEIDEDDDATDEIVSDTADEYPVPRAAPSADGHRPGGRMRHRRCVVERANQLLADINRDFATPPESPDVDAPVLGEPDGREFALPDDPRVAVAVNDAHRRADVGDGPGSDLWTIAHVARVFPRIYAFAAMTFAPPGWRPASASAWNQDEYDRAFAQAFPLVADIGPISGVVVAGGAAAHPLVRGKKPGDVDLFFVGLDPADEPALWRKADEVAAAVTRAMIAPSGDEDTAIRQVTQVLTPGLITICAYAENANVPILKVQLILRAYPSVSALLHAFDVPSACVAYDWQTTYTTTLGAFAHVFRANVVVPAYRSTTYESRLAKYFDRGFALVLPDANPAAFVRGATLELSALRLTVVTARGLVATGTAAATGDVQSDYEPVEPKYRTAWSMTWLFASRALYSPINAGIAALVRGGSPSMYRFLISRTGCVGAEQARERRSLPLAVFAARGAPTMAQLLPADRLKKFFDRCDEGMIVDGKLHYRTLSRYYGMSPEQIGKLAAAVAAAEIAAPGRRLSAKQALEPYRKAVEDKYAAATAVPIEWWVKTDPGRQYTASRNPQVLDPRDWYGPLYAQNVASAGATADDEVTLLRNGVTMLRTLLEGAQTSAGDGKPGFHDGTCAICLDACPPGANYVMLHCGHAFHWSAASSGDCAGLLGLMRGEGGSDRDRCPICRAELDRRGNAPQRREPVEIVLGN
jgi:hypothetical protein